MKSLVQTINESKFDEATARKLFEKTKTEFVKHLQKTADKFNPVPLESDYNDDMDIHGSIHKSNSGMISFKDNYGFEIIGQIAFNTKNGSGGINVSVGFKDGTYHAIPVNTGRGGFFKDRASDWYDGKISIAKSQKFSDILPAIDKWIKKWMPPVIKAVKSDGNYWDKLPSFK